MIDIMYHVPFTMYNVQASRYVELQWHNDSMKMVNCTW